MRAAAARGAHTRRRKGDSSKLCRRTPSSSCACVCVCVFFFFFLHMPPRPLAACPPPGGLVQGVGGHQVRGPGPGQPRRGRSGAGHRGGVRPRGPPPVPHAAAPRHRATPHDTARARPLLHTPQDKPPCQTPTTPIPPPPTPPPREGASERGPPVAERKPVNAP